MKFVLVSLSLIAGLQASAQDFTSLKAAFDNSGPARVEDYPRLQSFNKIGSPFRCFTACEGGRCLRTGVYEMAIGRFRAENGETLLSDGMIIQNGSVSDALVRKLYEGSVITTSLNIDGEVRTHAEWYSGSVADIVYRKSPNGELNFRKVAVWPNGESTTSYGACSR